MRRYLKRLFYKFVIYLCKEQQRVTTQDIKVVLQVYQKGCSDILCTDCPLAHRDKNGDFTMCSTTLWSEINFINAGSQHAKAWLERHCVEEEIFELII